MYKKIVSNGSSSWIFIGHANWNVAYNIVRSRATDFTIAQLAHKLNVKWFLELIPLLCIQIPEYTQSIN